MGLEFARCDFYNVLSLVGDKFLGLYRVTVPIFEVYSMVLSYFERNIKVLLQCG